MKVYMIIVVSMFIILITLFLIRAIGMSIYKRTPNGGINKSMYIDVNDTKQWINIYGKNVDNPVLLYLHGGPGSSTSHIDYAFTRKWADVYTIVTWDQRNCGKSYNSKQNNIPLTKELFLQDGKEVTKFALEYLSKEKLTILGHSWGSIYGANLVQEYPEYYNCFIGTGQLVDFFENEEELKKESMLWAKDDLKTMKLVNQLTPNNITIEHISTRNQILKRFGYDMMVNGTDYNIATTIFFNPNYSILDWINYFKRDINVYLDFLSSEEFASFSLIGKTDYQIPFYNINGDKDYQTNYKLAQRYFDVVNAPYKKMFLIKNMTHGLLESDSKVFSKIIHQISKIESKR